MVEQEKSNSYGFGILTIAVIMKGHGFESQPMTQTSSSIWLTQNISVWETAFWEIKLICNLCYWFTFCGSASLESIYKKLDKPLIGSSIKKLLTGHPKIVFEFQFWTFLRRANRKNLKIGEKKVFWKFSNRKNFLERKKILRNFFSAKADFFYNFFCGSSGASSIKFDSL